MSPFDSHLTNRSNLSRIPARKKCAALHSWRCYCKSWNRYRWLQAGAAVAVPIPTSIRQQEHARRVSRRISMRRSHLLTAFIAVSLLTTTVAFAGKFEPVSNNQKYRDRAPYTHAKAGSVDIEARALLRASGSIKVDITTGQLDDPASATDIIEKVQLKISTGSGVK